MKRASQLFTAAEREEIAAAVAAGEKRTSGEIVPVVATTSSDYERYEDIGGLLCAVAALAILWTWLQRILPPQGDWAHGPHLRLGLAWVVLIVILGWVTGTFIIARVGWLRRLLVPRRTMEQEVQRAAWEAFTRFRVGRTAGGTGVLLYVSLFERMVCVLGDEPISAKLAQEDWHQLRDTIIHGLRHGRPAAAIREAIGQVADHLAQHFPPSATVLHQLSNQLQIVDRV